jgi:hypothetical protein
MLGWLFGGDRCPVDPTARRWTEDRLLWLRDEFGADDLYGGTTVLPTPEFFPDPYDGSRRAVHDLFDRVSDYMGVEPGAVALRFFKPRPTHLDLVNAGGEATATEAAGLYEAGVIRLNEGAVGDPMELVGTMAHELAHQRLLGEGRLDGDEYDNELLTDLLVVFKGLGVFLANVPRHWDGDHTRWPGTDLRKPEYMTGPMFGYALAVLAWARGEAAPAWQVYLRFGVRGEFRQGLRFLARTGDCRVRPLTKWR